MPNPARSALLACSPLHGHALWITSTIDRAPHVEFANHGALLTHLEINAQPRTGRGVRRGGGRGVWGGGNGRGGGATSGGGDVGGSRGGWGWSWCCRGGWGLMRGFGDPGLVLALLLLGCQAHRQAGPELTPVPWSSTRLTRLWAGGAGAGHREWAGALDGRGGGAGPGVHAGRPVGRLHAGAVCRPPRCGRATAAQRLPDHVRRAGQRPPRQRWAAAGGGQRKLPRALRHLPLARGAEPPVRRPGRAQLPRCGGQPGAGVAARATGDLPGARPPAGLRGAAARLVRTQVRELRPAAAAGAAPVPAQAHDYEGAQVRRETLDALPAICWRTTTARCCGSCASGWWRRPASSRTAPGRGRRWGRRSTSSRTTPPRRPGPWGSTPRRGRRRSCAAGRRAGSAG